jgi:FAD/FMN-containing dehydrogenase
MKQRSKLISSLISSLGSGSVLTEPSEIAPFSRDWRGMFVGRPLAVALPGCVTEVAELVRLCATHKVPIVPAGGRTGLAGGATPDASGGQVVISLERLNRIREVDTLGETMTVEAGCILANAQNAAAESGLLLPISLASEGSVQIGGAIATNAGGSNVLRYGMVRNRLLGLEVVLSDGTIIEGMRALRKDNAGFDWKHWFVGSEGTLGIVTAAVLQLAPATPFSATALVGYASLTDAVDGLRTLRASIGDSVTAFELMERAAIDRSADLLGVQRPLPGHPWLVLVEARSALSAIEHALPEAFAKEIDAGHISDALLASSVAQAKALWRLRESITEAEAQFDRSLKHDVSVPISALSAFVDASTSLIQTRWPSVSRNLFGHAGDGNLHFNVICPPGVDVAGLSEAIHDCATLYGGSISAEHGIGQYRIAELARLRPEAELDLMRRMKTMLDPNGLLNPGKVLTEIA